MKNKKQNRLMWIVIGLSLATVAILLIVVSNAAYESPPAGEQRVSLADAKAAFDAEEALFVDVRSSGEYLESRIPGSVLIPLSEIAGNEPKVDKGALIYTYCT